MSDQERCEYQFPSNTSEAYEAFLRGLNSAGITLPGPTVIFNAGIASVVSTKTDPRDKVLLEFPDTMTEEYHTFLRELDIAAYTLPGPTVIFNAGVAAGIEIARRGKKSATPVSGLTRKLMKGLRMAGDDCDEG